MYLSDEKNANVILKATREGFSEGLIEAAKQNEKVYAVCADLAASVGMKKFSEDYPDRFVEVGVAEQNLVTVASGLAASGKIPFAASFAAFNPGRNWEQIRTTICYNNQPVKIIGSHAGLGVGEDGATHQMLEDVALMRTLPNMQVIIPCDAVQAKKATIAVAKTKLPAYMRIFRQKTPVITTENLDFTIGKIQVFGIEGEKNTDVCIISAGPIICNALEAKELLKKSKISCAVLNCHTIKPLDEETIMKYAKVSKLIAVVEDHQIAGGLGGAVAEFLSANFPKKILFIGVKDSFGESGKEEELYKKHGLDPQGIAKSIKEALGVKSDSKSKTKNAEKVKRHSFKKSNPFKKSAKSKNKRRK